MIRYSLSWRFIKLCLQLAFAVAASLVIGEALLHPRSTSRITFLVTFLIILWLCVAGAAILMIVLGFFIPKKDKGMITFLWFFIPHGIIGVMTGYVSNWHGFNKSDWIPVVVLTSVWQILLYLKYIFRKNIFD